MAWYKSNKNESRYVREVMERQSWWQLGKTDRHGRKEVRKYQKRISRACVAIIIRKKRKKCVF